MGTTLDNDLENDFVHFVMYWVGKNIQASKLGKIGIRLRLTKAWNSRAAKAGIPGEVRKTLGETQAARLFQDICDDTLKDPLKLAAAIDLYKATKTNSFKQSPDDTTIKILKDNGLSEENSDITLLARIVSVFGQRNIDYKVSSFHDMTYISAPGYGTIVGRRLPLRVESVLGGYDPLKCQSDKFTDTIFHINKDLGFGNLTYEHVDDPSLHDDEVKNTLAAFTDISSLANGRPLQSFVETIVRYDDTLTDSFDIDGLSKFIDARYRALQLIQKKLERFELP